LLLVNRINISINMFDFFDICYKNIDIKRSKFSGISEGIKKGLKED